MATTLNDIQVDFGLGAVPPRVTFLQGANMDIPGIRDTLRQIEESEEGRMAVGAIGKNGQANGWIVRAGGNFDFSDTEATALAIEICVPFAMKFQSGAIPFVTIAGTGSLIGDVVDSPGAIVQINNSIGSSILKPIFTQDDQDSFATTVWAKPLSELTAGVGLYVKKKILTLVRSFIK